MNARAYLSMIGPWRSFLQVLLAVSLFGESLKLAISSPSGNDRLVGLLPMLLIPLVCGTMLQPLWNRPLRCPTTALLPGIHRTLLRWNGTVFLVGAAIWAFIIHAAIPATPIILALVLSAGMATLGLTTTSGGEPILYELSFPRWFWYLLPFLWLVVPSFASVRSLLGGLSQLLLAHPWTAGFLGVALTAANLWLATD